MDALTCFEKETTFDYGGQKRINRIESYLDNKDFSEFWEEVRKEKSFPKDFDKTNSQSSDGINFCVNEIKGDNLSILTQKIKCYVSDIIAGGTASYTDKNRSPYIEMSIKVGEISEVILITQRMFYKIIKLFEEKQSIIDFLKAGYPDTVIDEESIGNIQGTSFDRSVKIEKEFSIDAEVIGLTLENGEQPTVTGKKLGDNMAIYIDKTKFLIPVSDWGEGKKDIQIKIGETIYLVEISWDEEGKLQLIFTQDGDLIEEKEEIIEEIIKVIEEIDNSIVVDFVKIDDENSIIDGWHYAEFKFKNHEIVIQITDNRNIIIHIDGTPYFDNNEQPLAFLKNALNNLAVEQEAVNKQVEGVKQMTAMIESIRKELGLDDSQEIEFLRYDNDDRLVCNISFNNNSVQILVSKNGEFLLFKNDKGLKIDGNYNDNNTGEWIDDINTIKKALIEIGSLNYEWAQIFEDKVRENLGSIDSIMTPASDGSTTVLKGNFKILSTINDDLQIIQVSEESAFRDNGNEAPNVSLIYQGYQVKKISINGETKVIFTGTNIQYNDGIIIIEKVGGNSYMLEINLDEYEEPKFENFTLSFKQKEVGYKEKILSELALGVEVTGIPFKATLKIPENIDNVTFIDVNIDGTVLPVKKENWINKEPYSHEVVYIGKVAYSISYGWNENGQLKLEFKERTDIAEQDSKIDEEIKDFKSRFNLKNKFSGLFSDKQDIEIEDIVRIQCTIYVAIKWCDKNITIKSFDWINRSYRVLGDFLINGKNYEVCMTDKNGNVDLVFKEKEDLEIEDIGELTKNRLTIDSLIRLIESEYIGIHLFGTRNRERGHFTISNTTRLRDFKEDFRDTIPQEIRDDETKMTVFKAPMSDKNFSVYILNIADRRVDQRYNSHSQIGLRFSNIFEDDFIKIMQDTELAKQLFEIIAEKYGQNTGLIGATNKVDEIVFV